MAERSESYPGRNGGHFNPYKASMSCERARLAPTDKRYMMRAKNIRPGDKLVVWSPRHGVHVHRIVTRSQRVQHGQMRLWFEDGGNTWAWYPVGEKLMVDRWHHPASARAFAPVETD